jgi:glutamate-1-semialdehyde 2,1-aminomutase
MRLVSPAGPVYQAGTLSGNPVAMTAGLWALQRLTPKLYKDLARRGTRLAAGFADAARAAACRCRSTPSARSSRRSSRAHPVRDYESALQSDTKAYAAFFQGMLRRGVYPPPSQFEAWFLSAAHTDRDVTRTIAASHEAMREVKRHAAE